MRPLCLDSGFVANLVPTKEAPGGGAFYRGGVKRLARIPSFVADGALALLLAVPTVVGLLADEAHVNRPWWWSVHWLRSQRFPSWFGDLSRLRCSRPRPSRGSGSRSQESIPSRPALRWRSTRSLRTANGGSQSELRSWRSSPFSPSTSRRTGTSRDPPSPPWSLLAAAWILGDNLRTRRAYLRELEEKAERLERERAERDQRAATEEQARIARELHDVIAHNVSVMVLQAAGGREVFDADPRGARAALASIETTGREALAELRRLLGVARASEDGVSVAPQPGLSGLETLVEQVRAAGLAVELVFEGERHSVPAGIELSAYRVVQEALTNTLRHAFARHSWVFVRRTDDELELEVLDVGAGPSRTGSGDGRGLVGMRERVGLFGGEFEAGPRPDGGFRVHARFPLREGTT